MQKIDKKLCIVYRKAAFKAERYEQCDKQKILGYLTCPGQEQAAKLYAKTGILLVTETTWEFHNAAWLVCFLGSCIVCAAVELPNRSSEVWSPESKTK